MERFFSPCITRLLNQNDGSDSTDYPRRHSFFSYSPDSNLAPHIIKAVEGVASGPSQTIRQIIHRLLASLRGLEDAYLEEQLPEVEMDDDGGSDDGYAVLDTFDGLENVSPPDGSKMRLQQIQR